MKTTNFGKVEVIAEPDGNVRLTVFVPGEGTCSLLLTADELMLFLVEVGNQMSSARMVELNQRIERDLLNEKRKSHTGRRGNSALPIN